MNQDQIQQLNDALEAVRARRIENVYFVACGGSKAIFDPAQYIFDRETAVPSFVYTANEFIHRCPKGLGEHSLVVSCSHSGNTPETVRATELAGEKGALTVSFSFKPGSPLWLATQHGISYTWGPESDPSESNNAMLFRLVFGVLNILRPDEKYERAVACCDKLGEVIAVNKQKFAGRAQDFGVRYKRSSLIYTMSSGPCYGVAYSFAICLLQEMLWVNSAAIHSGEYFHGPFEITDYDVPFIIIKNSGETRPLDERAAAFCEKYSQEVVMIDCDEFDMTGICDDLKGDFAVLVAGAVLRTYADALSDFKGHPLSVRRYMWRMAY
ncbi:MAG: SIS domain-containing protein [Clostridia bacterium]|nr:SIS domain-containing protein [Clostridia bacterium]